MNSALWAGILNNIFPYVVTKIRKLHRLKISLATVIQYVNLVWGILYFVKTIQALEIMVKLKIKNNKKKISLLYMFFFKDNNKLIIIIKGYPAK